MKVIFRVISLVDRTVIWASAIAVVVMMTAMVGAVVMGVWYRYVLNAALSWPEEFSRYSMIWVAAIGSGLLMRYGGGHIAVEMLKRRLSGWYAVALRTLVKLIIAGFLVVLLVYGLDMAQRVERQKSAALRISMSVPYTALPAAAALMLYHLIALSLRGEDTGRRRPPYLPIEN